MSRIPAAHPRLSMLALIASAGTIGLCTASAQDGALLVHVKPCVVSAGESATVSVLGAFPSADYALAGAQFNVSASRPAWTFASAGDLIGNDVVNIVRVQPHRPQHGLFANPANPYPVWRGVLSPTSDAPALVRIDATPLAFSVYPNRNSSSAVQVNAAGGTGYLLVNPLRAGAWLAAPGAGSEVTVRQTVGVTDDVMIEARIITASSNPAASIFVGMLAPAGLATRESAARLEFDGVPDRCRASVQIERAGVPMDSLAITYTKIEHSSGSAAMSLGADSAAGAPVEFGGFLGGISVATGDLNMATPNGAPIIILPSIPPRAGVRVDSGAGTVHWELCFDAPVVALIRGRDAQLHPRVLDSIRLSTPVSHAGPIGGGGNNLKQVGLGLHSVETWGVPSMRVRPAQRR